MGDQEDLRPSKKPRAAAGSSALTAFALRLAKKLADGDGDGTKDGNIAFSPLSIYTALGLVAAGARGKTLDELLALLGAASSDEIADYARDLVGQCKSAGSGSAAGPLVTFAYGVFHQQCMDIKPAYRYTAAEDYNAEIRAVNFAKGDREKIREEINGWAAAATSDLIPEILPEGSLIPRTRFVLTNAIYFKGVWETSFREELTRDREFHLPGGADPVEVPFMTLGTGQSSVFFSEDYDDSFKVLKLPYKAAGEDSGGARYSMCVFLPDECDGLLAMVDALAAAGSSLLDHVPKHWSGVGKVLLPKFKLSFFCSLAEQLEGLGLVEAFTEDADLSGMVDPKVCDVRLDEVFHKAVVEVNEEGTVAAACTAVSGRRKQCARKPMEFIADHPFAFYIVEEMSGAVVFAGHVLHPSS